VRTPEASSSVSPGELIARLLAGAWHAAPPPLELSVDQVGAIAARLFKSGASALAWWRLRRTPLGDTPVAQDLRQAYRLHALEAEVHALQIAETLARLRGAGIEPILVKGWAIARAYPEPGLRPYSDLDPVVRAEEAGAARAALATPPLGFAVDLHEGPGHLDAASFDELWSRTETASLGDTTVRVLGPEDHLRVLSLHALRHGIFRPLWLVDLAVALEARPASFDWSRCLGPDRRQARWVAAALGLAHRLLGAEVDGTPVAERARRLPRWLERAVLRSWDRCEGVSHRPRVFPALFALLADPRRLGEEVRLRWDRPIQATLDVGGGPFSALPRLPFQVAATALRVPELIRAAPNGLRRALRSRALRRGAGRRSPRAPRRG
jgi:hypothetical protein